LSTETNKFDIRGALEGFYGPYYSPTEREDLICFIGRLGMNHYLYAPKQDKYQRDNWREPYRDLDMARFANTVKIAEINNVSFDYCISPGGSIEYSSASEIDTVWNKFVTFYDVGVRNFGLLLDDIEPKLKFRSDQLAFSNLAEAQSRLGNEIINRLKNKNGECQLSICPTIYHGAAPFSEYESQLARDLDNKINIFYTGPEICSQKISHIQVENWRMATGRKPLIWDNYPVNDLGMKDEMHLGPLTGREELNGRLVRGLVANLMNQAEASKIPLYTVAKFLNCPENYLPDIAWEEAVEAVVNHKDAEAWKIVGKYLNYSCLNPVNREITNENAEGIIAACKYIETTGENRKLAGEIKPFISGLQKQAEDLLVRPGFQLTE
jgi:hyaluronoglucosaminidase